MESPDAPPLDEIESVNFDAGDFLFMESEKSYHLFVILEGQVEIFKTTATGKKVPLAIVSEGSSIGEFAMIDRCPRSASARALTAVRAMRISDSAYETLLAELPDWAVSVLKGLVERVRQTNDIIRSAGIVDGNLKERIDSVLHSSGNAGTVMEDHPLLRDDGPQDPDTL